MSLAALHALILHAPSLIDASTAPRILSYIQCVLVTLPQLNGADGRSKDDVAALMGVRKRVLQCFEAIRRHQSPATYEMCFSYLLKLCVECLTGGLVAVGVDAPTAATLSLDYLPSADATTLMRNGCQIEVSYDCDEAEWLRRCEGAGRSFGLDEMEVEVAHSSFIYGRVVHDHSLLFTLTPMRKIYEPQPLPASTLCVDLAAECFGFVLCVQSLQSQEFCVDALVKAFKETTLRMAAINALTLTTTAISGSTAATTQHFQDLKNVLLRRGYSIQKNCVVALLCAFYCQQSQMMREKLLHTITPTPSLKFLLEGRVGGMVLEAVVWKCLSSLKAPIRNASAALLGEMMRSNTRGAAEQNKFVCDSEQS